ncbi:MAG: thioredoxin family protein [Cyanobacteria bacterium SZAS LIN-2]|nr:thioredoxin family protein [Cyanobacteria bacterium SZAS LIN-2]MBS2006245.1 thioredoxin family protein [Cyanobacteria bacterium SZAS TMP-1]
MVMTASTMLELGTTAPDFELPDVMSGAKVKLSYFTGKKALLVMFICRHCPFVKHIDKQLAALGHDYGGKGVGIVAISSNDAENYPEDSPAKLKDMGEKLDFSFPLLYDESQKVAKAYKAACTPDFFLFDADFKLVYRGQLDASRPGNQEPVTGKDLRDAIDAVLAGKPVSEDQHVSTGCNIKWKAGNEPKY